MLDKIKAYVEIKYFNRQIILKTLHSYENMMTSNHVIYHNSYVSYCNHEKTSTKRLIVYWLFWLLNLIHLVEFFICIISSNQTIHNTISYPVIVMTDHYKIVHILMLSLALDMFLGKIFIFSLERNRRAHILTLLHSWQTNPRHLFGLNKVNTNKLIIRSQLVYWTIHYLKTSAIVIMNAIILYYSVKAAYLYHNYHLAHISLHTIIVLIWFRDMLNFAFVSFFSLVMPITMINYKFDEILKALRVNIRWNNATKIIQSIEQHDKTTRLLNELGDMYSRILFVFYMMWPYTLSAIIKLLLVPSLNKYFKVSIIFIVVIMTIVIYFFNYICASITVRNKNAPKYLYSKFIRSNKLRISIKMKIEAFLLRLITDFIGIYCLNMFKFTKLTFYQYFMTISSAYVLIYGLDK